MCHDKTLATHVSGAIIDCRSKVPNRLLSESPRQHESPIQLSKSQLAISRVSGCCYPLTFFTNRRTSISSMNHDFHKRHIYVSAAVALFTIVLITYFMTRQLRVPTSSPVSREANLANTAPPMEAGMHEYKNAVFHFSLILPDQVYLSDCGRAPLAVAQHGTNTTIGTYFTSCPEKVDPTALFGWTIYTANNIKTQADANHFVQQVLGPGCRVTEWGSSPIKNENEAVIMTLNGDWTSMDEVERDCPFILSKYRAFYSSTLQTLVFWSLGQEPEFVSEAGSYDDEVLASFRFVHP
jgi:hypothetical protein